MYRMTACWTAYLSKTEWHPNRGAERMNFGEYCCTDQVFIVY